MNISLKTIDSLDLITSHYNQHRESMGLVCHTNDLKRLTSVTDAIKNRKLVLYQIECDNKEIGFLPCWQTEIEPTIKFGYLTIKMKEIKSLLIPYQGCLFASEYFDPIVSELFKQNMAIQVVSFEYFRRKSSIFRKHFFSLQNEEMLHWITNVPETIDSFYQKLSKKHRGNVKRAIKKCQTDTAFNIRVCETIEQLGTFLKNAHEVSVRTYQYSLNAGLNDLERYRVLLSDGLKEGRLDFTIAYFGEQPVAFQIGYQYYDTYYLDMIAYKPEYSNYSIGTVLFFNRLEILCGSGIKKIDYGFGDAEYKQSFGDEHWQEATIEIYRLGLKTIFLCLLKKGSIYLNSIIKRCLGKSGALTKIKSYWRKKLVMQEESQVKE